MPTLVGGPGSAGYDAGFYIRGGDFLLRINADDPGALRSVGLGRRGPSSPRWSRQGFPFGGRPRRASRCRVRRSSSPARRRATSATTSSSSSATTAVIVVGQFGQRRTPAGSRPLGGPWPGKLRIRQPSSRATRRLNYDNTREAWIEWCLLPVVQHPDGSGEDAQTTRQMMVAPELPAVRRCFAYSNGDVIGWLMPGYTDRNRDHGLHGSRRVRLQQRVERTS